jgi:hypothetical protein
MYILLIFTLGGFVFGLMSGASIREIMEWLNRK